MPDEPREVTLRWRIDKDLALYQFYLDISVKALVFLMAVSGAVASYALSPHPGNRMITISLLFPAILDGGFAVLFFYSAREATTLSDAHKKTCQQLKIAEYNMR